MRHKSRTKRRQYKRRHMRGDLSIRSKAISASQSQPARQRYQNTPPMTVPRQACRVQCIIRRAPTSEPASQHNKSGQPYPRSSLSNEGDIVEHIFFGWEETKVPRLPGLLDPSWPSSWAGVRLPSCSGRSTGSTTPPCPTRSLLGLGSQAHHRPLYEYVSLGHY